jgi:precorrin-8X/cobalt-precorrin-8 methylmutase
MATRRAIRAPLSDARVRPAVLCHAGMPTGVRGVPEGGVPLTWPSKMPADAPSVAEESYRVLRSRIDLSPLPKFCRDVTERVISASADFDYFTDLILAEEALAEGVAALIAGAPVIVDTTMVAAGISGSPVLCKINEPLTQRLARTASISRAAAAVRLAFGEAGPGAVWVVGGYAALAEILNRGVDPAFVVGMPVGFVGAAEAKDALRASGLPCLSNVSEKGGPAVAAAAFNALLLHGLEASGSRAGWGPDGPPASAVGDDGTGY